MKAAGGRAAATATKARAGASGGELSGREHCAGVGAVQIGVTLHRKHDAPAGAFHTGIPGQGYVFYLRQARGAREPAVQAVG